MKTRHFAPALVAGALLVAGCGGSETPAQSGSGQQQQQQPGGGFLSSANVTKLANELGVSESKLQSALKSIMPQGGQGAPSDGGQGASPNGGQGTPPNGGQGAPPNGTPPAGAPSGGPTGQRGAGGPGGGQLAGQLAKKLGLPKSKVEEALQSFMPQRPSAPTS